MSGGPDPAYVAGHCVVVGYGVPRMTPLGIPETVMAKMPADAGEFIDTWHVVGMRGTDSCDFAVDEVFVVGHLTPTEPSTSTPPPQAHRRRTVC